MNVDATPLEGVLVLTPRLFEDTRGAFFESFNARAFREATGVDAVFVQDNQSTSVRGVLRGIHYQLVRPQGKLVRAVSGSVLDVAVDLRRGSPAFGRWTAIELSARNRRQVWIPAGFGHAYLTLSESADLLYKTTEFWYGEHDRAIAWNDAAIGIQWPIDDTPLLSARDAAAPPLERVEVFE